MLEQNDKQMNNPVHNWNFDVSRRNIDIHLAKVEDVGTKCENVSARRSKLNKFTETTVRSVFGRQTRAKFAWEYLAGAIRLAELAPIPIQVHKKAAKEKL